MNQTLDPKEEAARTVAILRYLQEMKGQRCKECAALICGHEALMSLVLGFQNAPRCCSCLAHAHGRTRSEMGDHLLGFIASHRCHHAGWVWANREEQFSSTALPSCLWPGESAQPRTPGRTDQNGTSPATDPVPSADAEWDAGDMGCGDLVLHLRLRLQSMQPKQLLKLTSRDPGAPEDLPAWCRMTGNSLINSEHPIYWIQRKEK